MKAHRCDGLQGRRPNHSLRLSKRSAVLAPAQPAASAVPDQRAGCGDQRSLQKFHFSGSEHIPGDDPNEDTDTFRQRKGRRGVRHPPHLPVCPPCSFSPQWPVESLSGMLCRSAEAASLAKKCWREVARKVSQFRLKSLIWSSFGIVLYMGRDDRGGPDAPSAAIASAFRDVL